MTKSIALIFGEDQKAIEGFGETLKATNPEMDVRQRFVSQLLPNYIEECDAVYMLNDYPAVREAYGEKAVLVEKKPDENPKKVK